MYFSKQVLVSIQIFVVRFFFLFQKHFFHASELQKAINDNEKKNYVQYVQYVH